MEIMIQGDKASKDVYVARPHSKFPYTLARMLQEEQNSGVVEWLNGKIIIYNIKKLESDVLSKYFNHSKYTSFLRQLNNFGFIKLKQNQKPKFEGSVYVNESTTLDIQSIMRIKSKHKNVMKKSKLDLAPDKYKNIMENRKLQEPKKLRRSSDKIVLHFDVPSCGSSDCKCCSIIHQTMSFQRG